MIPHSFMPQSYGALPRSESNGHMENGELKPAYSEGLHDRLREKRENPSDNSQKHQKCDSLTVTIAGSVILSILATFFIVISNAMMSQSSSIVLTADLSVNALTISSVSNVYGIWDVTRMLPYSFLENSYLVEPYRETVLKIDDYNTYCPITWIITNGTGFASSSGTTLDGNMTIILTAVGEYSFTAVEKCGVPTKSDRYLNEVIWVKYVRREISSLNDLDREEFLDAFRTMWTVSTTNGRALYGDRYKSVNFFATLHNDGGGNTVCDEFHGGLGFLNNHMFLSAYLEQSLQLINPKTALHYMDYIQYFESSEFAAYLKDQMDGGKWTEILSQKYFGASDPYTGRITDGRWANATVPYMTAEFFAEEGIDPDHTFFPVEEQSWLSKGKAHVSSPYGLLRSPWNYNPSPLLTRYGDVFQIADPSVIGPVIQNVYRMHSGVMCSDYSMFFSVVKEAPLETFLLTIEDGTHGALHFTYGGVGGDVSMAVVKVLREEFGFTTSNIIALAQSAQPYNKKALALSFDSPLNCTTIPWQDYTLTSTASPAERGGPHCDFDESYYSNDTTLNNLVDAFYIADLDPDDKVRTRLKNMEFKERSRAMKIVANMFPYDGDLAGAGAAMDPLFWVSHGAVERVYQKSMFANVTSDKKFNKTSHCSGHSAYAVKAWLSGFYFVDESVDAGTLTNQELTNILDPNSVEYRDLINFVYDKASFDHCSDSTAWFS